MELTPPVAAEGPPTMQDRPTVVELLDAIADTLDQRVLPAVDASARHDVRVAANLCRIIRRELDDRDLDTHVAEKARRLLSSASGELQPSAQDGAPLLEALCALIENPDLSAEAETEARSVAMEIVQAKLAVTRPGYDAL